MKRAKVFIQVLFVVAVFCTGVLFAQRPARNISAARHPNLAVAQRYCGMAIIKITAAQEANEWDMEGHAQKAKELLTQANNELRAAARAANKNVK